MVDPEPRIAHIARDARQDVERAACITLEVLDMAAVAVRMQVRREDDIDARLVKERHPGTPLV